jgi:hypothetical protein
VSDGSRGTDKRKMLETAGGIRDGKKARPRGKPHFIKYLDFS